MMSEKRFSWKTEKLQHLNDEVLVVVDNENKEWKGHILNIVDLLNKLSEENEQLKSENKKLQSINDQVEERLESSGIGIALKMDCENNDSDETFKFNKNCAKPYEIRNVSPNGVIRIGSKNHKVNWRMKDVREINNELPPREEFNREEYNKLRNKYHTKNWYGDDVLGRIIYNIYNGTFEGLL